ncbi:cytochrome P450 [Streptomyces sp. AJS327]|uniref:cytochrome P450 n=1 Tax=Streptomyces sp. AJS327 TaxID=2545265 RepID=UPI0027E59D1B|nr:cytochrome P450 [Streptomyces sp. AJS327]
MSSPPSQGAAPGPMPPPLSQPSHEVTPLYGQEFADDPHAVYARLRRYGAVAPVELAPGVGALLVIDYRAALDLLHDTETWSKDSRSWQDTVPSDSPILPMLEWRPNVLWNDGETHERYRQVITDGFSRFEPSEMRDHVMEIADTLISRFGATGEADLISQYARSVPLMLLNRLFGLPDSYADQLYTAVAGMLDGKTPEEANEANAAFTGYVTELVTAKLQQRGPDLTSWFLDHPVGLSTEEVVHQIVLTMAAGLEPATNLIGNALARMLSDDRYYSTLSGGGLTPRDAIHDVLHNEPPMSNYSAHFPRRDIYFHGTWIRAGQLVMVSYAAANTQRGRTAPGQTGGAKGSGGGAHLAWAAGPHTCPVPHHAALLAMTAIERLTAWLSDIELTVGHDQLVYRHGPFHRALAQLPARFTPISPHQAGATPWDSSPQQAPSSSTRSGETSPEKQPVSASVGPRSS